jgi:hypothetical protein
VRRAQLAVVAHIRHVYTNYDRLLRIGSYQDARSQVEQKCLEMLVGWRGSDENGDRVLEDVIREVVVISDDEDSDDEDDEFPQRDSSIEIVSSVALAHEVQTQPTDLAGPGAADATDIRYVSDDEGRTGYRIVPAAFRKRPSEKRKVDRRGFSRYQAWDQAFDRYRRVPGELRVVQPTVYDPIPAGHPAPETRILERGQPIPSKQYASHVDPLVDSPVRSSRPQLQFVSSSPRPPRDTAPSQYSVYRHEVPQPEVSAYSDWLLSSQCNVISITSYSCIMQANGNRA